MLRLPREPNGNEPIRAADMRLLLRAFRSIIPASSSTIRVRTTGSGTTFELVDAGGNVAAAGSEPSPFWATMLTTQPTDGGATSYTAWINEESDFRLSDIPSAKVGITGLGKAAAFKLLPADSIWLVYDYTLGNATIGSLGQVTAPSWDDFEQAPSIGDVSYADFTTTTDLNGNVIYSQTFARIPIAEATPDPKTGAPILRQLLFDHVQLAAIICELGCVAGRLVPYGARASKDFTSGSFVKADYSGTNYTGATSPVYNS